MTANSDRLRGAAFGLLAAATFGISAPLAKLILREASPLLLAGLLYLGATIALFTVRAVAAASSETPLKREDLPTLIGISILGGVLGPVLMLGGLRHATGAVGSLLLNLEAPLTILVAVVLFREHLGRHAAVAAALILGGAAILAREESGGGSDLAGVVMIFAACLCWAFDNNLTQRLTIRDPFAVVRIKAISSGIFSTTLALAMGAPLPRLPIIAAALSLGAVSYGASIVLDAYALRLVGAAREAAYFATAPFLGVAMAWVLGDRPTVAQAAAILLMGLGVAALLRERHGHSHRHERIEHEHRHEHDDGHHHHRHASGAEPLGEHSHLHLHEEVEHDHSHFPDLHHRHRHE